MPKRAILYVDLLGVQKMWGKEGALGVKNRLREFSGFVCEQINWLEADLHRSGDYTVVVQGDSVSVICEDFEQAIGIGIHLFTQAFYRSHEYPQPFWFRGAISEWHNQYLTVNTTPISAKGLQVGTQYVIEDDYLKALALEKSGYKGMRLIIDRRFLAGRSAYQREWPCPGTGRSLSIVARLQECNYPAEYYSDVLWMANSEKNFRDLSKLIASRFKRATSDPEELMQAAWTRAVFDQLNSLVWSLGSKRPAVPSPVPTRSNEDQLGGDSTLGKSPIHDDLTDSDVNSVNCADPVHEVYSSGGPPEASDGAAEDFCEPDPSDSNL